MEGKLNLTIVRTKLVNHRISTVSHLESTFATNPNPNFEFFNVRFLTFDSLKKGFIDSNDCSQEILTLDTNKG